MLIHTKETILEQIEEDMKLCKEKLWISEDKHWFNKYVELENIKFYINNLK